MFKIGLVKIDTFKAERQFHQITFSDTDCIKALIKNRHIIDPYLGIEKNMNIYEAGDVSPVNQELICIYIDLLNLINRCKLSDKQRSILDMLMIGYTEEDIAEEWGQDTWRITDILNTACEKIKKLNDQDWKYEFVYLNYKKVEWDYKKCSKCGISKPAINDFFSFNKTSNDGFHSVCKDCK